MNVPPNVEVIDLLDSDSEDDAAAAAAAATESAVAAAAAAAAEESSEAGGGGGRRRRGARIKRDRPALSFISANGNRDGGGGAAAGKEGKKRSKGAAEAPAARGDDGDDDDVIFVDQAAAAAAAAPAAAAANNNDGSDGRDGITIVGTTGPNVLADFPHSREHCVVYPRNNVGGGRVGSAGARPTEHCPNCFCWVCDCRASDCRHWSAHCAATYGETRWRDERERLRAAAAAAAQRRRGQQAGEQSSRSSSSSSAGIAVAGGMPAVRPPSGSHRGQQPAQRRSRNLQQQPPPVPVTIVREESAATYPPQHRPRGGGGGNDVGEDSYTLPALLDEVAAVLPMERSPPSNTYSTRLRHYQRQSLAFMVDIEEGGGTAAARLTGVDPDGRTVRGGWLSSEVGMGKSAIVIALVAIDADANRGRERLRYPLPNQISQHAATAAGVSRRRYNHNHNSSSSSSSSNRLKLKTTVVLTSASLMGQWEDEVAKHAPGLVVKRFHPQSRSRVPIDLDSPTGLAELANVDIIVSTATFPWPASVVSNLEFHRVVMDEAHLFGKPSQANLEHARRIRSGRRWCVTATPFTLAATDLIRQAAFLGHTAADRSSLFRAVSSFVPGQRGAFRNLADELGKVMTRHTKSQSIGGSDALALPQSTTTVVLLQMSPAERAGYTRVARNKNVRRDLTKYSKTGVPSFTFERRIVDLFNSPSNDLLKADTSGMFNQSTKIRALCADLEVLSRRERNMRVVVFTQYTEMHRAIVKTLRKPTSGGKFLLPSAIYEFSGTTNATARDFAIRCFQSAGFPAVIVITLKAGSAGITLTSASRLYMMEPSIDPTAETQAAGRIHRLGQTRPVEIRKFAFEDSLESNIVSLHGEIREGRITVADGRLPASAVGILGRGI